MSLPRSALPPPYFAIFGIYEPLLTAMGFIGALMDPIKARNSQLPFNVDSTRGNDGVFVFLFSFVLGGGFFCVC
jgi:hypothetical protein